MRVHRRSVVVFVGLTGFLPVSVAFAELQVTDRYVPQDGPVLVDGGAVVADSRPSGGVVVSRVDEAGKHRLAGLTAPRDSPYVGGTLDPRLAASGSTVVIENDIDSFQRGPTDFYTGSVTFVGSAQGGFAQLGMACESRSGGYRGLRSVDVSGSLVGLLEPRCTFEGPVGAVSVQDRSVQPPSLTALSPSGFAPRVAGRFAAWLEPGDAYSVRVDVVVYDLAAGAIAYRVPVSQISHPLPNEQGITSFALSDDGSVAYAYVHQVVKYGRTVERVGVASPDAPGGRTLALPDQAHYAVRLVGGQLAVLAAATSRSFPAEFRAGTLRILDLASGQSRLLASGVADRVGGGRFDFDGHRVAFVTPTCAGATVHVRDAQAPALIAPPLTSCPVSLTQAPVLIDRKRVRLFLSCAGYTAACGTERVRLLDPHDRTVLARLPPGNYLGPGRITISPTRAGSRRLKVGHRYLLTLDTSQINGRMFHPVAPPEHRRSLIRLTAP